MTLRETIKDELHSALITQHLYDVKQQWYSISETAIEWFLHRVLTKLSEGGYLKDGEISED